ncbi:MAG TPA: multidrug efflux SMR transporter [Pseudomonadales bacterium]|nr:multidrug efflux SMR transporter [Pseudomonadales bacterium]
MQWLYLAIAIVSEVIATSAVKSSDNFTHLLPSILVVIGYGVAFYFLSLTLRTIPLGVTYAIWSGAGVAIVSIVGAVVYKQILDTPAIIGIALIVAGVVVLNLFSKSVGH